MHGAPFGVSPKHHPFLQIEASLSSPFLSKARVNRTKKTSNVGEFSDRLILIYEKTTLRIYFL